MIRGWATLIGGRLEMGTGIGVAWCSERRRQQATGGGQSVVSGKIVNWQPGRRAAKRGPWVALATLALVIAVPHGAARAMFGPYTFPPVDTAAAVGESGVRAAPSKSSGTPHGGMVIRAGTTAALAEIFDQYGYRLDRVMTAGTVPRLFVAEVPPDMAALDKPAARKALFIRIALPLVLAANEAILRDRARIERLRAKLVGNGTLAIAEQRWMGEIFAAYGAPMFDFAELLRRVDIVPPSLAIAQGAEESGWGTSRFAREGNALFGQRIFRGTGGLVPRERAAGERYCVRRFARLFDAVRAYAANLNSHPAYVQFRSLRAGLRGQGRRPEGLALVDALRFYSERRAAYVATLRQIIRIDRLTTFDRARLGGSIPRAALGLGF